MNVSKKKKQISEEKKLLPAVGSPLGNYQQLQTYNQYVDLIEKVINGVLDRSIARQDAHTVAILTGYGINALREATGGKLKMSVFMQDMRKVNVEMLSSEDMDRFLQGDENTQIEVLKQLEDKGGIVTAEVKLLPRKELKPKLDTKLISDMSGIAADKVKDALEGSEEIVIEKDKAHHDWARAIGKAGVRFCMNCGLEREMLQPEDMESVCSMQWGLS